MSDNNNQPHRALTNAGWLRESRLQALFDAFASANAEIRVVGGAVRNQLLGVGITDIDLATPVAPEAMMALAEQAGFHPVPTGIEHGTVTIVVDHAPFEVTTLRKDVETDGRRAVIEYTNSWAEDAMRRDFTMNALYCDARGHLFDPVGGLADLKQRRVRFIGEARQRIREDYLRILRFFRFNAQYANGAVDAEGLRACEALRAGLLGLSGERIGAEMSKLLVAPAGLPNLRVMAGAGLLHILLQRPQMLARLRKAEEIEASMGVSGDAIRRLAALALYKHEDARHLATRFKLAKKQRLKLEALAAPVPAPQNADSVQFRGFLYRAEAMALDHIFMHELVRQGPPDPLRLARQAAVARAWKRPEFPLRAADLIAAGRKPGPALGVAMRRLESLWIDSDFTLQKAEMLQFD